MIRGVPYILWVSIVIVVTKEQSHNVAFIMPAKKNKDTESFLRAK